MSVKYKTTARRNLLKPTDPVKYYAIASASGKTDIDKLSRLIANNSTVSRTDVYAVIMGLLETVAEELADGNTVSLGKLGSFSVNVKSDGAETADAVTTATIKGAKIVYRPGTELKNMLKTLKYEKKA
jgi:predicted histone-like DNA-binding protein